ncbi:uncharacterized protein RCC_05050 [Ramularia collo-cygni]|uniref:Protein kinase domain-containing protein n=1 Tax=Ramularia collo-cygni TaxID=112498 RepID=A0A2D3V9A9_9PEZI|nr:uncharacterized protein RCC_05050 [Ramularia collo-cygni]CZT19204.1 uncharacterized protein RCC_05050 [Ramularia collo-cygni]
MIRVSLAHTSFCRAATKVLAKPCVSFCTRAIHPAKTGLVDEEFLSGYRPSSYFPVKSGDVIHQVYNVKVKLGFGRSSTSWLCTDQSGAFKVLKISTASDTATREARVFDYLHDSSLTTELQGRYCVRRPETTFDLTLDGRTHQCFVFEPLGPSLHEFALHRGGLRIDEVRFIVAYLLYAVEFLHSHNVVHTDIKLDNVQLMLPDNADEVLASFAAEEENMPSFSRLNTDGSVVCTSREMMQETLSFPILCDLGAAEYGQLSYEGLAQPLPYRAPEVILGASWNHKVDIWSLGVLRLFRQSSERDSIRLMIQYMGLPPRALLERCSRHGELFDTHGHWSHGEITRINLEDRVDFDATNLPFFDFLRSMLTWDPDVRLSASQLLKHPWLNVT